jgi:MarR family multiple antibiotic resistance transcriptional regulator
MATTSDPATDTARRLFDDLVRSETRLYNALNDQLRERHGIVGSQFEFLRFVRDSPTPRVADLAANFAVGIGAISKGMDRLEKLGLLRRLPNPADRRSSLLALTDDGRSVVDAAELTFTEHTVERITASLSPAQLAAAVDALGALRGALERDQVGIPVG